MDKITENKFKPGTLVRKKSTRDCIGSILDRDPEILAGEKYYSVLFQGANPFPEKICETDLEVFDGELDIKELLSTGTYGSKQTFSRTITLYKLREPLRDHIYALFSSKTDFQPYQFKPVLKYLNSQSQSLLLADEVGLGKTIEAGLILTEEMARKEIEKILIICPARLRQKWQEEFKRRFNLRLDIKDAHEVFRFFQEFREHGYPRTFQAICSLESLRKREFVQQFEISPPPLDFLIIDEAHHLRNSASLSHRLGMALREGADSTLLLTATPVHLKSENFLNLLRILSPEQFADSSGFDLRLQYNEHIVNAQNILYRFSIKDSRQILQKCKEELEKLKYVVSEATLLENPLYSDIIRRLSEDENLEIPQIVELQRNLNDLNLFSYIMCRTRKRDASERQSMRCPEVVTVEFTPVEGNIYRKIEEYVKTRMRTTRGTVVSFALTMPQRLAASCLPAALEYYLGKIDTNEVDGEDVTPDGISYNNIKETNLDVIKEELRELKKQNIKDSKLEALIKKISQLDQIEPGRKMIIFSYFLSTLEYLEKELTKRGYRNIVINGRIPSKPEIPEEDERGKRIKEFRENPEVKILLASEVGSEGLDFEFTHILFNYDLPWNPMLVEQRIGRLDRYNQKSSRILIYNMAVKGTVEERILQRLYDRIGIFEKTIGDLEPILGEIINRNIVELLASTLTPEEEEQKVEQISRTIENKRQEYEKLEQNRVRFVGYDTFFTDEIEKVQRLKRYLSDIELYVFVKEFLEGAFKKCTIEKTDTDKIFTFHFSNELIRSIKELKEVRKEYKDKFENLCYRYLDQGMPVTFSSEIAYEKPDIEYINIHHPLVKLAVQHYLKNPTQLHPVSKIQLNPLPDLEILQGDYLFYVYAIKTEGFQSGITLEPIFINLGTKEFLPSELSELLLAEMVASGETFAGEPSFSQDSFNEVISLIKCEFENRLKLRKEHLKKTNEASIENIRTSFRTSLQYTINRKRDLLDKALRKNQDERYIRMLNGHIKNLEETLKNKMKELDAKKDLSFSPSEIAAGYLKISS